MNRSSIYLLLVLLLLVYGCSLEEPGTPKWEVELTVPIADRVYSLSEIIDDSLEANTASNYISSIGDTLYLNFSDSLESVTVGDELQSDGLSDTVETYVGVRTVDSPGNDTASFQPAELEPYWGTTTPVPPFYIAPVIDTLDAFDEYDWMYAAWGDIILTITNALAVPLDRLNIQVRNGPYATYPNLLIVELDTTVVIQPDESIVDSLPLPTGETDEIDNELVVLLTGHSPGSGLPVTVLEEDRIYADVAFSDIGAHHAQAHVPAQTFSDTTFHALEDDDTVKTALIKDGTVSYSVRNGTPLINTVTLKLPDFSLNSVPFTDQFELEPDEVYSVSDISLAGYQYERPQQDNLVEAIVIADILDTNDPRYPSNMVIVHEDSSVNTDLVVSQLTFSHLEGNLNNTVLDIEQQAQVIEDLPDNLDSLAVELAEVEFQLINRIGGNIELDLILIAYKDGSETSVTVPTVQIPAGSTNNPYTLNTIVDGLETIFNIMPDSILPTGQARISGPVDIYDTQWIEGEYRIYSPFWMALGECTLDPEISTLDDGFDNFLNHVSLTATLENHVPLSGEFLILASYDSTEFSNSSSTEVDTFFQVQLPQATLNATGYVDIPGFSTVQCDLDSAQLDMFSGASEEEPLFIETLVIIYSTDGQTVRARTSDYLTVGAAAHLIVDMDFEDEEEGE